MKGFTVIGIVIAGLLALFSYKSAEKPFISGDQPIPYKKFFQIARSELNWILPEVQLRVVKICQGEVGEEFGYVRPIPKTFVFVNSTKGIPEIVTARIRNLAKRSATPREIQSQRSSDLNHFLMEHSGVLAEHGRIKELQDLDHAKGTRRYEAMMEEALWLCTTKTDDWDQKDIEMSKLREEIMSNAGAYIAIEWPMNHDELSMEVFYEVDGRTFKADLISDLFRI